MTRVLIVVLACFVWQPPCGAEVNVCNICKCHSKIIDCSGLELTLLRPTEWKDISGANITYSEINLSDNFLASVPVFPPLNINKLNFRNNRIVKIDNQAFRNLTRLSVLDLSYNKLTSDALAPDVFEGRYSPDYYEPLPIETLDLSGNELHSLNELIFVHLPHIRRLNLKQNKFKILDIPTVKAISGLSELEHLDLSYMKLRDLPAGFLHNLRNLKELILEGNSLTRVPESVLHETHDLASLNLGNNPIEVILPSSFPEMPSLKLLKLSHMPQLKRIENFAMHGLKALETFYCSDNPNLHYLSPLTFAANENDTTRPNVTALFLSGNALRYLSRDFLDMEKVTYVDLTENKWSCDCQNQWMVSELVPLLIHGKRSPVDKFVCVEPEAMAGKRFLDLFKANYKMRCLDYYGHEPQNDSAILITVFSIIITIMVIGLIAIWKVKFTNCRARGRSSYSRAFYRTAHMEER